MEISKIIDGLYLSGTITNYDELDKLNIDVVINVRAEQHDDISELTNRHIAYYWIPINDYYAPRMNQIETFLEVLYKHLHRDNILVHCAEGRGRSAMFIAVHLVDCGYTPTHSILYIQRIRPQVSLTDVQYKKLIKFYEDSIHSS